MADAGETPRFTEEHKSPVSDYYRSRVPRVTEWSIRASATRTDQATPHGMGKPNGIARPVARRRPRTLRLRKAIEELCHTPLWNKDLTSKHASHQQNYTPDRSVALQSRSYTSRQSGRPYTLYEGRRVMGRVVTWEAMSTSESARAC